MKCTHQTDSEFGEFYHCAAGEILVGIPMKLLYPCEMSAASARLLGVGNACENCDRYGKPDLRRDIAQRYDQTRLIEHCREVAFSQLAANRDFADAVDEFVADTTELGGRIAFCWIRAGANDEDRNSVLPVVDEFVEFAQSVGRAVVACGDRPDDRYVRNADFDATHITMRDHFGRKLSHIEQLFVLNRIVNERDCKSIGLQAGGMDGSAYFLGLETIFISTAKTCQKYGMFEISENPDTPFIWLELNREVVDSVREVENAAIDALQ